MEPLSGANVAVVGLGSLGAPAAVEFARAQVQEVRLLDGDFVEPGTSVRWPLGLQAAGRTKTAAISEFISLNYPRTKVVELPYFLGRVRKLGDADSEAEVIGRLLHGVDLILDASAEFGVSYFLSDLAKEADIDYVSMSTTLGGWGGIVVRLRPDPGAACWLCLQTSLTLNEIQNPPSDHQAIVQPEGCSSPTFTGPMFDLLPLVSEGVRMAVSTLCEKTLGAYPPISWDVGVLSLRDEEGRPQPPSWATYKLEQHPACPRCGQPAVSSG
jgi:hypothetical protein